MASQSLIVKSFKTMRDHYHEQMRRNLLQADDLRKRAQEMDAEMLKCGDIRDVYDEAVQLLELRPQLLNDAVAMQVIKNYATWDRSDEEAVRKAEAAFVQLCDEVRDPIQRRNPHKRQRRRCRRIGPKEVVISAR